MGSDRWEACLDTIYPQSKDRLVAVHSGMLSGGKRQKMALPIQKLTLAGALNEALKELCFDS